MANGAEAYLQMWERAEGVPGATLPLAHRPPAPQRACATSSSACRPDRFLRRAGQPQQRDGRVWRWCLKQRSIDKARITAVLTRRGRSALVATNARAQRAGNIGVGDTAQRVSARASGSRAASGSATRAAARRSSTARAAAGSTFAAVATQRRREEHADAAALPAAGRPAVRRASLAVAPLAIAGVAAPVADAKPLEAKIQRTKYGVPHITAKNIESLAAGFAYAFAQDNICTIAAEYVTVNAERSQLLRPGRDVVLLRQRLDLQEPRRRLLLPVGEAARRWSRSCSRRSRRTARRPRCAAASAATCAGYNQYLRDRGVDRIPDPRCRGKEWVRPIKPIDVYRRFFQLGILASSGAVIDGIVGASPVSPAAAQAGDEQRAQMFATGEGLSRLQPQIGSNAYGLGREATDNGRGMVLGNPHFPWDGSERLYQAHLRIPGKVDVAGGDALRRAADPDRPHARPGVVAHRRHRVAVHARSSCSCRRATRTPTSSTARRSRWRRPR